MSKDKKRREAVLDRIIYVLCIVLLFSGIAACWFIIWRFGKAVQELTRYIETAYYGGGMTWTICL